VTSFLTADQRNRDALHNIALYKVLILFHKGYEKTDKIRCY